MRSTILGLTLALALPLAAQRHRLGEVNAETPEGQLLQLIGQESDAAKRVGLLDDFAAKYPKHEAYLWVLSERHTAAVKAGDLDTATALAEKLIAGEPDDVETAHATLKLAEAAKNPDTIRKWAVVTSEAARKAAASKKPEDEEEEDHWKRRVDFAKQVDTYTEYAIYAQILQVADPNKKLELAQALTERNPQSQYLPQVDNQLFMAYMQLQNAPKALEVAERVLAKDPTQEDMLLMAADYHFNQKNYDKASDYSDKLVDLMRTKAAPAGVAAADWENKKNRMIGLGLWIQGVAASLQNKYAVADKILRDALPQVKDNEQLYAAALFHLGLANFRLGDSKKEPNTQRILDALRFSQQCAAIKSPYQARAQANVNAIKGQYRVK
jgi:tetratricopeptide (TPR) repeat protein